MRIALIGIACGSLLIPLNSTMLAVALPSVMKDLGVGASGASLLVTIYLITMAVSLPISGALTDRVGAKRLYLTGLVAFAITSLTGALAWSFPVLVATRAFQAVSGSLISPSASALIRALAPEGRRGSSFGFFDMIISISAAVGPFLGGVLAGAFGWRSLFVMAVPVSILAAAFVTLKVKATPPESIQLHETVSMGVLFSSPAFLSAFAGVLGATVVLHSTFIVVPILTQQIMGEGAAMSGAILLTLAGLGAIFSPIGGKLSDRVGRRSPAVGGSLLMAGGLLGMWAISDAPNAIWLALLLSVVGIGFGLSGSPRTTAAVESIPSSAVGRAAGVYLTSRYVGGALGAGVAGAILGTTATLYESGVVFVIMAVVAVAVSVISLGLPNRVALRHIEEPVEAIPG